MKQGCGSGFNDFVESKIGNPDPGSGSRGKKMKKNKYFLVDFICFYN
jgi:hypothetical protein